MRTAIAFLAAAALAQTPPPSTTAVKLTLAEAQAIALKNHPAVSAALLIALAAGQVPIETRSALYPTITGAVTAAGAADQSRIAAGNLNNPIIYNRFATGITIGQVLTDFGRTSNLVESAKLRAQAQQDNAAGTRAQVLLQVNRAYFSALRAQKVLTVAEQTVATRQVVAEQVNALAQSKLKSGLDVSFANVNLSEAKLLLASAQNDREAAQAELSNALGYPVRQNFDLEDAPTPPDMTGDMADLMSAARQNRPELLSARAEQTAADRFVKAERALAYPTLSALASAGVIPAHDDALRGRYGAVGVNLNIPVFNGHLFSARRTEAEYRAQAAEQSVRDLENRITRDVQVALLNVKTADQRLGLTAELLREAAQALDLAQTRYDLGLSSIVELTQAQLYKTSAEIASATARYDYALQRAVLDYQTGVLK